MGQEVSHSHFSDNEFTEFEKRLKKETLLLKKLMSEGKFSEHEPMGGFEVEAWLVDPLLKPSPVNNEFFEQFNNPLATPELAKFNIELNNTPLPLKEYCFERFEKELQSVFQEADQVCREMNTRVILTGILPTLLAEDCSVKNMSDMKRYKALNQSVLKSREYKPLLLDIKGKDHFQKTEDSVMMESATTSFQIHLQTPWSQAHHYYNASIIASAPLMAMSDNSPFLFEKQLWHETRIPLFEQSVNTGEKFNRVSFGTGYAEESISECFEENLNDFPVILPMLFDKKIEAFSHLRLHNGVIWRWNRPLIGFDEDKTPHVRIEQRILPAGPTIVDMMANAAFYYGLTRSLMEKISEDEHTKMPFEQAKNNFYQAAKHGLDAELVWCDKEYSGERLKHLFIDDLIPRAYLGLSKMGIKQCSIEYYLNIIENRIRTGQTGAVWQIKHLEQVNGDYHQLTSDYLHNQHLSQPVHTWAL